MLEEKVKPFLKEAWSKNYKAYGAPRLKVALQRELGINFSIRRITRLMKELGIRSLMCRRFKKPGTHVDYDQRPNLIKNLSGKSIWRADITYLQLENGVWVYLSTVFDDQTYKILSQKVSKHMTSKLVSHTLIEALKRLKLTRFFPKIVDPSTLKHGKLSPDIYLEAAKLLKLNPEQCAGIEDAKAGADAINAANEISIGIGNKDILKQADIVFSNTEKLTLDNIKKFTTII